MTKCLKKLKTKGKICINLSLFPSCGVLFPHHLRDLLKIFLQVSPPPLPFRLDIYRSCLFGSPLPPPQFYTVFLQSDHMHTLWFLDLDLSQPKCF